MGKANKRGRQRGGRNRGYYYRKGRGWYAVAGTRSVPLTYINGVPIRDKDTDPTEIRQAHRRFELAQLEVQASIQPQPHSATLAEVCDAYLAHIAASGAKSTHYGRANILFDLCFALPAKWRRKTVPRLDYTPDEKAAMRKERCQHPPYGALEAAKLTPLLVDNWLDAHPTWKTRRTYIQTVKRALSYAVERQLIDENPIAAYKVGRARGRITYFTPEQELLLLKHARPALKAAIQVCIRTGLRYGVEFVTLTAEQVVDSGDRMEWRVTPKKTKASQKYRTVLVKDPTILDITRQQIARYPTGPIFRNSHGGCWDPGVLTVAFVRLRRRVTRLEGVQFDADACMNTCRHTFAKRVLAGYWSGQPQTIETLARLMGNTPQVCWNHYVQWSPAYNQALWDAI